MNEVITIGSATVDAFAQTGEKYFHHDMYCYPAGGKIIINDLEFHIGGGGTNTAVALSRLGLKTAYIGKLGTDDNANRVLKLLEKEKVDTSLIPKKKGRTGFSVVLDAKQHDRTILTYKGSNDELSIRDIPELKCKWIYLSSMVGKAYKTIEKAAVRARKQGIKVAFNPSSYLAKQGKDYLERLLKNTTLLIMNKEEASMILNQDLSPKKLLQELHNLGPEIIVITDGKNLVRAYDGKTFYQMKPTPVKIVETTGAGDAFASSFLAGLIKKNDISFALKLGLVNSQSVIQHHGAKNKLLTYKKAMQKIKNIEVKMFKS